MGTRLYTAKEAGIALIPLVFVVGYLCQLNDTARLYSGAFFAAGAVIYLTAVHPWYAYPLKTLMLTYAASIGAALYGVSVGENNVSMAILAVWSVLHFGPKEKAPFSEQLSEMSKAEKTARLKKSYLHAAGYTLAGIVAGFIIVGAMEPFFTAK